MSLFLHDWDVVVILTFAPDFLLCQLRERLFSPYLFVRRAEVLPGRRRQRLVSASGGEPSGSPELPRRALSLRTYGPGCPTAAPQQAQLLATDVAPALEKALFEEPFQLFARGQNLGRSGEIKSRLLLQQKASRVRSRLLVHVLRCRGQNMSWASHPEG